MDNNYKEAKKILNKYNQKHVVKFLEKSDEQTKNKLINQILKIDFEQLKQLYEKTFEDIYVDLEELQPIAGINPDKLSQEEVKRFEDIGIEIIKNNKFAIATMAGGQGTRLRTL
ncbi:MAG: hypothetical protein Q4G09_02135 [Clostridia bacterium]|nr:hypothetical protein [Clostridia bacterium]